MKLAQALQERADLNRKIQQLSSRISANALVQEGEKPAEDPKELLTQLEESTARLETLITAINLCNSRTVVDGESLTGLIARRDCLTLKLNAYRDLVSEASQTAYRASRSEIKIMSAVDVRETQKMADELAKQLRLTDGKIQEINWTTEIDV